MKYNSIKFLPPKLVAILENPKRSSQLLIQIFSAFVILFIIIAYFCPLEEITKGMGKVIPSSRVQIITNLEGGIIKELMVTEGQIVEKDQILVRLDPTLIEAHYQQGRDNYYRFLAATERVKALISGQEDFTLSEEIYKNTPTVFEHEKMRFLSRLEKYKNDLRIAEEEVRIKQQEVLEAQAKDKHFKEQLQLVDQQLSITKPLVEKTLSSKIDYLKLQRESVDLRGQSQQIDVAILRTKASLQQAEEKLKQIPIKYKNDDLAELRDLEVKLAEVKETMVMGRDRLSRTEIKAPRRGTIKEVKIKTVGGVIKPGEDLIELVPLEDTLLIEAQISPADVAFLSPGLSAVIKITAYDYAIYGGLSAVVEHISADTLQEKDRTYYRVLLRTDKNYIEHNGKTMPIIPGMQAETRILTGHKTLLQYIMKPIIRGKQNALTER